MKEKYQTIDEVNRCWNTSFWSHDYQNFDQIESPSSIGESSIQGLYLDWRRFVSYQTTDFCRAEIAALREAGAVKPVTTKMLYKNPWVNYFELADAVDIVSWDSYPFWHKGPESQTAVNAGIPALTVNRYGKGQAYYVCADAEQGLYDDIYAQILREAGVRRILEQEIPDGVAVSSRRDADTEYIFIQNFNPAPVAFCPEVPDGEVIFGETGAEMKPFSTVILERKTTDE